MKKPSRKSPTSKPGAQRTSAAPAVLLVSEFAARLRISIRHAIDLIEEGQIRAVNVAGDNPTDRKFYRIPIEEVDRFLKLRASV